jgi:hypothetical protein
MKPRRHSGFLEGYTIRFVEVEKDYYQNYVGYGGWFYNMSFDFPLLQLVWPDKQHKFPWEEGEDRNLGVYTTKQAFQGDPILYVYHNEDGDWQFHTSESPSLLDAMLVCLEQITKLDPTINELFHLELGGRAWREDETDEWHYGDYP